ncbi:MAG: DNA cytosine methyltransferase [Vannielia sp.]|uniref:DNA cytosine methyltransferase n=1 Tax=Vannielia sp. TaxID=2813045 RepID=UPI003B8B1FC4
MTLCSGIGAPEMAAPWVDWRFASEIEAFPRSVLQQRFGYRPPEDQNQGDALLWGDMTEVTPDLLRQRGIPLPDLIVAGTPCQAFSVAGARKGLEDPRGNLTLAFVEICHAIVAARPDGKLAVLWENVPGVLSDEGNAFGAFLGGLVGALDALPRPAGASWPGEGMVQGPRARAAWAVLDAQHFGVAQRRRRVFVVVDFGNCCDPAQILLEPDSLRGDSPPRREAGERTAPTLAARTRGGGGLGTDAELDGALIPEVVGTLSDGAHNGGGLNGQDAYSGRIIPVAHALRGEGFDASEDGTGRGTPIVPVAIQERAVCENPAAGPDGAGWRQDGTSYTLEARTVPQAVAFDCKGTEVQTDESGVSPPLRSMGHLGSHQNAGGHAAVAFAQNQRDEVREMAVSGALSAEPGMKQQTYVAQPFTLMERGRNGEPNLEYRQDGTSNAILTPNGGRGGLGVGAIAHQWQVRRLTPRECSRLQGFPDDHTEVEHRGKPAADGPQYKAYGNSMAVPCIRWILNRLRISWENLS